MESNGNHVQVVPYLSQGHINPMFQFSKRLISKGLKITLAIIIHVAKTMETQIDGPVQIEMISDGHDEGGMMQASSVSTNLEWFKVVGSKSLKQILQTQRSLGNPVRYVVYDLFLPWALDVTKQFNLLGAAFYTQSCVFHSIYYNVQNGVLKTTFSADQVISVLGLPPLDVSNLPSFTSHLGPDPSLLGALLGPYCNTNKANWVLFNIFDKLEVEVVNWTTKAWKVMAIRPTIPSMYLDKRIDVNFGFDMFVSKTASCLSWLNSKKNHYVIYVSFCSISVVKQEQTEEIAWALLEFNFNFLWVCTQLEVLSHPAVRCFATHCGWNSVLETLNIGVPMIGFPQWIDQPTNAKCIKALWKMGIRPKVDETKISGKRQIVSCVREIMKEDKWDAMKKNTISKGGRYDKNIDEFVAKVKEFVA
ncbi:hypothetical protein MKW94_012702 [Papaver nudicaule]|uniref:Glycosyltransferase n=1 Tax=Papaver nudicaule TaxID=74823 RepID=A0AA41VZ69_PAPNU|nr:hypothetical protein [Papaver nudicaule]